MSDLEFDMLDELYFVRSYADLAKALGWNGEQMLATLQSIYIKGWLRCYKTPTEEILHENADLKLHYKEYHYLASKTGLIAHNSIE